MYRKLCTVQGSLPCHSCVPLTILICHNQASFLALCRKVRSGGIEGSTSDIRSLVDQGDNLAGEGDSVEEEDEGER